MTGRYPKRSGLNSVLMPDAGSGMPASEVTLAELLKSAGYDTAMIGKWHMGDRPGFLPTEHGFDEYFGLLYSNDMVPPWVQTTKPRLLVRGTAEVPGDVDMHSLTRRYVDDAVRFVGQPHKGLAAMFVMMNVEARVPADHPLRAIKKRCTAILAAMRRDFDAAYSPTGRPSIPPEQLLKAMLLQALYSIRSEIQLMQAIEFNLLYRWFLDIPGDAIVWTPEVFSMNRERFARHDLVRKFFDRIVSDAMTEELVSSDHFTADGTLIRSWASLKSLVPKGGER
jgi:transposase